MLIESAMPRFDAVIAERTLVRADAATVFHAARTLDFLTVATPLLTASMWVRGLPERLRGRHAPPPPRFTLDAEMALPGWLLLGERPGREVAFGAVGKFWKPTIEWRDVSQTDFPGFAEPGWGKIAANFSVESLGEQTSLGYECRTVTTDPTSRRRFLRYWWLVRPFVGHIMRATLAKIKADAEAAAARH